MTRTNAPGAEGFLLITIQNVRLSAPFYRPAEQTGLLALECVTIPVSQTDNTPFAADGKPQRDVWLVLRVNQFELPLSATEAIRHSRLNRTFTFKAPEGLVMVTLPAPINSADSEDLETFEVLLAQYGVLQETDPPKAGSGDDRDLKGRLVLVDEDDGEVVGTLGEQFSIKEAQNVAENDKAPVIIDIPEEGQHTIYVQSINPEEQDFILKSAQFVSRGLIFATDMIGKGMGIAADYYVKNTTPNAEPMVFSETSKDKMRRIHNISGKAVQVSAKTTGLIHGLVDRAVEKLGGVPASYQTKRGQRSEAYFGQAQGRMTPPPLPPRGSSKGDLPRSRPISPAPGSSTGAGQPPPLPPRKPRMLNRLLISTDLLLTTLENSAQSLVGHTTDNLSSALGHKYGPEMGSAVKQMGDSVKNVGVVYIDVRGVGRRALIRRAGKRMIRGKMGDKEIVFGAEDVKEDGTIALEDRRTPPAGGSAYKS